MRRWSFSKLVCLVMALTNGWALCAEEMKHGNASEARLLRPRPPCLTGRDACDQVPASMATLVTFMAVSLTVSSIFPRASGAEKSGAVRIR